MVRYNEPKPVESYEKFYLILDGDEPKMITKSVVVAEKIASENDNMRIMKLPVYKAPIQLTNQGEYSCSTPLCNEDVIEIFYADGDHETIAKKYNITKTQVSEIKNAKKWRHITEPLLAKKWYDEKRDKEYIKQNSKYPFSYRRGLELFDEYFEII